MKTKLFGILIALMVFAVSAVAVDAATYSLTLSNYDYLTEAPISATIEVYHNYELWKSGTGANVTITGFVAGEYYGIYAVKDNYKTKTLQENYRFTHDVSGSNYIARYNEINIDSITLNPSTVTKDTDVAVNMQHDITAQTNTGSTWKDTDTVTATIRATMNGTTIENVLDLEAGENDTTDDVISFNPETDFGVIGGVHTLTIELEVVANGITNSDSFDVEVVIGNEAPVALNDSYSVDEDDSLSIPADGVLANDDDADGDPITAVLDTDVSNGTLVLNPDGSFDYTPDANFSGTDTFTYTANDGYQDSNIATVTITVNAINDVPVASDDTYATDEDTALNVPALGVMANDTDADPLDVLTAVLDTDVSNGTLTLNTDGSFNYTPDAGFNGADLFTYHVNDGTVDSNIATVTINIGPVNDVPVALNDSYSVDEDGSLSIPATGVLANDTDADGDALTAILVLGTLNGGLTLNADGSFDYTPNSDFNGVDTFTYVANDGTANSTAATVTITVNSVEDVPIAKNDSYAIDEDTVLNVPAPGVLGNDTDGDGDSLTSVLDADVTNGTLTLNADGSFDYTPDAGFNGADSFTYHANDGDDDSNIATVTITVNSINDVPVANDDAYDTMEDVPLSFPAAGVLINDTDADGDALTAALVADVTNGTLTLNADGSFDYAPDADFNGVDTFTYLANDGTANSTAATVTITVIPVNDAPVALDDSFSVMEDSSLNVPALGVLGNDSDVDGDALTALLDTDVSNGALTLNADGSFNYTPDAGFYGVDSFTYTADDGTANSNVATVTITVTHLNHAPVAVDDSYATNEDTALNIAASGVLGNDSDVDAGDVLTALLASDVSNGTLTLNADGSFGYTPDANFNGVDTFTYVANDGAANSTEATVTITVNALNDAPVANDDSYSVAEDGSLSIAASGVLGNDSDVDGDALTAVLDTDVSNGALTLNADGSFDYTPNANFNGVDSFTYVANDGAANSTEATVTITVTAQNDAPVAANDAFATNEDTALNIAASGVLGNDTDIDLDALTAVLDTNVLNGTLVLNANGSFTYTPDANFNGADSFTYHANDGTANSNIATVTITVNAVNDAPVAVPDSYSTDMDVALNVPAPGVLENDSDVEGQVLTPVLKTDVSNGTLQLWLDGSFNYTPDAGFVGVDTFTYAATDGALEGNTVTVTITVNAITPTIVNSTIDSVYEASYGPADYDNGLSFISADSYVEDSTVNISTITSMSEILRSTILNCTITNSTVTDSWVENTILIDSASTIAHSIVKNSTVVADSTVQYSTVINSIVDNSTLSYATFTNVKAYDSTVTNSTFEFVILEGVTATDGMLSGGVVKNLAGDVIYNFSIHGIRHVVDVVNFAPTADAGDDTSVYTNADVHFSSAGTSDPNIDGVTDSLLNDTLTYLWNFGDGDTSTSASPTHDYNTVGDKTVTLTVTDKFGRSDSDTLTVTVTARSSGGGGSSSHESAPSIATYDLDALRTKELSLAEGQRFALIINGVSHTMMVSKIAASTPPGFVEIYEDAQMLKVNLEESIKSDVDADYYFDLQMTVKTISASRATMLFEKMRELTPEGIAKKQADMEAAEAKATEEANKADSATGAAVKKQPESKPAEVLAKKKPTANLWVVLGIFLAFDALVLGAYFVMRKLNDRDGKNSRAVKKALKKAAKKSKKK